MPALGTDVLECVRGMWNEEGGTREESRLRSLNEWWEGESHGGGRGGGGSPGMAVQWARFREPGSPQHDPAAFRTLVRTSIFPHQSEGQFPPLFCPFPPNMEKIFGKHLGKVQLFEGKHCL